MKKVEENKKMNEIKNELFELRMYIEDQYTERYGWSVDGKEVLKRVYQLMELVHGKKVEKPLVEYEDELMLQMNEAKNMEVKVVDFWINTYGGYTIKYSDGSTRSLCKEHLIEVLNGER